MKTYATHNWHGEQIRVTIPVDDDDDRDLLQKLDDGIELLNALGYKSGDIIKGLKDVRDDLLQRFLAARRVPK